MDAQQFLGNNRRQEQNTFICRKSAEVYKNKLEFRHLFRKSNQSLIRIGSIQFLEYRYVICGTLSESCIYELMPLSFKVRHNPLMYPSLSLSKNISTAYGICKTSVLVAQTRVLLIVI